MEVRTDLEHAVQTLRGTSSATLARATGDTIAVLTQVSRGHDTQAQEALRQVQTIAETLRRVGTLLQTSTGDVVKTTSARMSSVTARWGTRLWWHIAKL